DLAAFRTVAEAVVARQFPGSNILVLREDGQQLMNTALPPGAPLPARRNTDTLRQVHARGRAVVSDVFIGIVVHRPVVSVEVPVKLEDGRVLYALSMNPGLDAFGDAIGRQRLRDGWVVAILDRQGAIVARRPNLEQFVGQKGSEDIREKLLAAPEGIFET